jgi:YVTN family beta-propeller protein
VANAGSNDLSVIGLQTQQALAHIEVGAHPRGLALSADGGNLYVNNVLDGVLSVVDTQKLKVTFRVPLTAIPLPAAVLLGKQLFHSSATERLARDQWISCAVCHFDGAHDARTWQAFPDGPRNTPSLFGVGKTLPVHWSGDLDELQDVELTFRNIQAGKGLVDGEASDTLGPPHAGRSAELDAVATFMDSLTPALSPCTSAGGGLTASARRGQQLFAQLECASCHAPPLYTDRRLHDVGTGDPALERNSHGRGTQFDTPSLIGIWGTAPYFHDGSAATLRQVLDPQRPRRGPDPHAVAGRLTAEELEELLLFLRSLPFLEGAAPPGASSSGPSRLQLVVGVLLAVAVAGLGVAGLVMRRRRPSAAPR